MNIALLVILGALLLGGLIFMITRFLPRTIDVAKDHAQLEAEGIELETGKVWLKTEYRGYRAPGIVFLSRSSKRMGYLVLTRQHLVVMKPRGITRFDRKDMGRFTVSADGDKIHIHSDDPPNATGSIEWIVPVSDAGRWVKALTDAGARAAA